MGMRLVAKRIPAVARAQPFGGTALCTAPGDLTPLPGLGSFARLRILPLDEGRCPTTGGTDFDCVVRHALDNRFGAILIVTDGMGGFELRGEARRAGLRIFVLLTEDVRYGSRDLVEAAERSWLLDDVVGAEDDGAWPGLRP